MIPHTPAAIGYIAQRLMTHVAPELRTQFGVADLALIGTLLSMIGQDFERAAEARLQDIREMRDIFSDAERVLKDDALIQRTADARAWTLSDLHVSVLDEAHALHSRLLIEVHTRVEQQTGGAAQQINLRIWEYLARHAARHSYEAAI